MSNVTVVPVHAPSFPRRLASLKNAPGEITLAGRIAPGKRIAIVGTRDPAPEAVRFARLLACEATRAGAVILSGGAFGIDAAAHEGALEGGGRTCIVAPCGYPNMTPRANVPLYERVLASGGGVLWPFPAGTHPHRFHFFERNRILVALSDVVVVVQSPVPSGTLNAARHARDLGRPLWVVVGSPWDARFEGSLGLIAMGAQPLWSRAAFYAAEGLDVPLDTMAPEIVRPDPPPEPARRTASQQGLLKEEEASLALEGELTPRALPPPITLPPPRSWSRRVRAAYDVVHTGSAPKRTAPKETPLLMPADPTQRALLEAVSSDPRHLDEIAARARVCASAAATALLTLALENVVVEGPEGFYRRGN